MAAVIGVLGGHGGAGATAFAAALAGCGGPGVFVDLDPLGGGVDVAVGVETVPGVRWSGLHADGGRVDPAELVAALPAWGAVSVLACDSAPSAGAVASVLAAARAVGPTVIDLGRSQSAARRAALDACDAVLLVAGADVRCLSAALAVIATVSDGPGVTGVVVRAARAEVPAGQVAEILGAELRGELDDDPALRLLGRRGLDPGDLRRSTLRLCRRLAGSVDTSTTRMSA